MLLECLATGISISKQEAQLLDLELESQIASIKVSRTQGCIEIAPDHICKAAFICKGSFWISCLAAVLDQLSQPPLGKKSRGAIVFDQLLRSGYIADCV